MFRWRSLQAPKNSSLAFAGRPAGLARAAFPDRLLSPFVFLKLALMLE